jgi:hypothetical protein
MNRYLIILAIAAVLCSAQSGNAAVLSNGDFNGGNLNGWTTFLTANGDLGAASGLPDVVSFDVDGDGTASLAARFLAGEKVYNSTDQGGGIYQNFTTSSGLYTISANVAAQNPNTLPNDTAGIFILYVDGTLEGTCDFKQLLGGGTIQPGQIERSSFSTSMFLAPGTHEIRLQITRNWLNAGGTLGFTPLEYADDIQVTPVPEPSMAALGIVGVAGICWRQKKRSP